MFYCNACAEQRGWPQTGFTSYGLCEICEKTCECNDRPSRLLPPPKTPFVKLTQPEPKEPDRVEMLYTMTADQKNIQRVNLLEVSEGDKVARVRADDGNEYKVSISGSLFTRLARFAYDNGIDLYDPKQVSMIDLMLDKQRSGGIVFDTIRTWNPALKR